MRAFEEIINKFNYIKDQICLHSKKSPQWETQDR